MKTKGRRAAPIRGCGRSSPKAVCAVLALVVCPAFYFMYANIETRAQLDDVERIRRIEFRGADSSDLTGRSQMKQEILGDRPITPDSPDENALDDLRNALLSRRIVSVSSVDLFAPDLLTRFPQMTNLRRVTPLLMLVFLTFMARVGLASATRAARRSIVPINWRDVPERILDHHARSIGEGFALASLAATVPMTFLVWRSFSGARILRFPSLGSDPMLIEAAVFPVVLVIAASAITRTGAWLRSSRRRTRSGRSRLRVCTACGYDAGPSRSGVCSECGAVLAGQTAAIRPGLMVPGTMLALAALLPPLAAYAISLYDVRASANNTPQVALERVVLRPLRKDRYELITLNYAKVIEIETQTHRCIIIATPCSRISSNSQRQHLQQPDPSVDSRVYWAVLHQPIELAPTAAEQWEVNNHGCVEHRGNIGLSHDFEQLFVYAPSPNDRPLIYVRPSAAADARPVMASLLADRASFRLIRHTDEGVWIPGLVARVRDELRQACERGTPHSP
jgi:hypothetical protein